MRTFIRLLLGIIFIGILSSCELTDENIQDIGSKLDQSMATLKGENSVILNFSVVYDDDAPLDYTVYINHKKDYVGLVFLYDNEMNYRYIIHDKTLDKDFYYEYHASHEAFGKTEALGKTNYVYEKLSFGQYDIPYLSFSMEQILQMVNNEQVTLNVVTSDEEALKDLNLYEVTINLDYFIDHDTTVLFGLYGDKVLDQDLEKLRGVTQTITLGYDESGGLKYFAYNQDKVLEILPNNIPYVDVRIFVDSIGETAEANMETLESSDVFPNLNNGGE